MRKLTTVLSKNQKLHSMNTPHKTKQFERKTNLSNEMRKQMIRQHLYARDTFIEANLPYIEAVQEAKQVSAYLKTEEQANHFTEEAVKIKLSQMPDTRDVDAAS